MRARTSHGVLAALRSARSFGDALAADAMDAIWPRVCWVCGSPAATGTNPLACEEHDLGPAMAAMRDGPRCGRCAGRLPPGIRSGLTCAACRLRGGSPSRGICAIDYRVAGAADWLLRFKHGARRDLAVPLAGILAAACVEADGWSAERLLVPVPLHPARRLERGYDQAAQLAAELEALGAGRRAPLLLRNRHTPAQGAPGAPARAANVRGAFAVRRPRGLARGVSVWLVDDVLTTGATAAACALALRRAGAREVGVLAVARAGGRPSTLARR
ncbi:MAG: ComF family protein [Planctomycetota bacterium]|nr:ComF family protein [Planctomycetota bacterium]